MGEDGGSICHITNWPTEADHNANGIAAFPDMLSALQGLIDPTTGLVFDQVAHLIGAEEAYAIESAIEKALKE